MFRKRTLYDIFKLRILLYFVAPIVLAAIIVFANHQLNIRQYYKMYNEFYRNYTDEVFFNIDKEINTIVQMDYWLKNEDIKRVFDSSDNISDAEIRTAIEHMRKMKSDFNIIDSMLIVDRKSGSIVATNGKATMEKYFSDIFRYKDYGYDYFKDIRYPVDSIVKLPPTAVESNDGVVRYVMPIIKMAGLNDNPNSFFIFNISLDKLMEAHTASKYTVNTSFWFVNKKNRQFYSAGGDVNIPIDEKIWDIIEFDDTVKNYEDINGGKYCVITKTVSPNLMDYAYIVFIPVKDVDMAVSALTLKIVVISVTIYLLFVMIVLLLASDIGKSFATLLKPLNFTEQVKMKDIFKVTDKISKEFSRIFDENTSMKQEIKSMIGDVKEKMIADVLNNKNRQVKMSLYKYDNFIPIVIRIIPQKQMDEKVLFAIEERLYSSLRKYFDGMYESYDITNRNGEVHFVLNVPSSLKKQDLEDEIKKLAEIVSNNEIDVEFAYHIGEKCNSFDKLRNEYLKLSGNSDDTKDKERRTYNNEYIYRVSESNSIINSILEGDSEKTIASIDRILITNVVNDVSDQAMKVLYQNIINTMITALRMKKIDVDRLVDDMGGGTYFSINERSETEITLFILNLIEIINSNKTKKTEEGLAAQVVRYIDENYNDYSLSLEHLAKQFGVDEKNISRYIKKYTGITFHKYLTEFRIEEAKKLLITTDMSVEQIYNKVGYVSRTTFMRAFNSVEKITPSEYRKKSRE